MTQETDKVFLTKWRKEYYERDDREEYTNRIYKKTLTPEDIKSLLEWKSKRYKTRIKRKLMSPEIVAEINVLRKEKDWTEAEINTFVKRFYPQYPEQAPIFGTFIKHVIKPDEFPVYDVNVHKAYHDLAKIPDRYHCLMDCYPGYSAFFKGIKGRLQCSSKELDEALWAYGSSLDKH